MLQHPLRIRIRSQTVTNVKATCTWSPSTTDTWLFRYTSNSVQIMFRYWTSGYWLGHQPVQPVVYTWNHATACGVYMQACKCEGEKSIEKVLIWLKITCVCIGTLHIRWCREWVRRVVTSVEMMDMSYAYMHTCTYAHMHTCMCHWWCTSYQKWWKLPVDQSISTSNHFKLCILLPLF